MKLFGYCSVMSLLPLKGKNSKWSDRTAVTDFSLSLRFFFFFAVYSEYSQLNLNYKKNVQWNSINYYAAFRSQM